jgi:hypothetical protein
MDMFPIAPDGALMDRVAEFAFLDKNSARRLYSADPDGYRDALGKFLQVLACSGSLLGDLNFSTSEQSAELKRQLQNFQKMEHLSFLPRISLENDIVDDWFAENWAGFCAELQNPDSAAYTFMIGHIKREHILLKEKNEKWQQEREKRWQQEWEKRNTRYGLYLPPEVRKGLKEAVPREDEKWIEVIVSTHFWIFGDYYLNFSQPYLPAATRSSLRFLASGSSTRKYSQVSQLIMPFVVLKALQKVKQRKDLVESVVDWTEGRGRAIVNGLRDLQNSFRIDNAEDGQRLYTEANLGTYIFDTTSR